MPVPDILVSTGKAKIPAKLVAGRYELRELLGEGGMGVVFRAVDTRTGGAVAIKTMRDVSDPRTVEMFKKEWRVLARLSHPNIVDIRDVDEIEEDGVKKPCFVMPLLPGTTLATLIKESSRRLTVERVVGMLCQVCNGLEAAHKADLIHRDLKPSNIFIMEDDTAKLIDFGLVYSAENNSMTGYKGTWQYMAPEQTEGKRPTVLSDVFSLGVVAYETFTARKPFSRTSVEATVEAIRSAIPPAISEINPKVSQLLSKVIHKAIAKQPMHRYASAREFAETLQKAFHNQPIERFETARILPRIERARKAFEKDDCAFASEILTELEAEGNVDPEISLLRAQIEEAIKHKRVRQLFEGAQTRLEQDEIPLALDKLREVLELDAGNADALSMRRRIEEQRNSQQISDWMKLALQHVKLQDFAEARQALKEVLNIRYDDSDALQLLADVDVQERDAVKARSEKELLYGSALRAYQGGEISTALSKLEKILEVSRRTPGATIPERDAVYQSFYNRVRTERDSIDKGYEDGRRLLNEKEFGKAIEICDQMLVQYPSSAQFQALKLRAEQAERQELSAYIAEVGRSADAEPNLDRRVSVLEEACRRYPNEAQFQQSLRLIREQRDLVHSISAKARQYEEQGQFADSIGQWKILRNIHPQYPGVDVEIGQLERRREQQTQEDRKARFVEQIDHAIDNGAYGKALRFAGEALAEFPQDSELIVLEKIARQGLERGQEAERLCEDAKRLRGAGRSEEATELLQRAFKLDERNLGMRNALVSLLVERAQSLLDQDWRRAEPLAEAAIALDEQHPAVKRLRMLIAETKRKDCVTQCLAEARELQVSGDLPAALKRLGEGLAQYPEEARLVQCQASLQNSSQQGPKSYHRTAVASGPEASTAPPDTGLTGLFQRSEVGVNSIAESVVVAPTPEPLRVAPEKIRDRHSIWIAAAGAAVLLAGFGWLKVSHRERPGPVFAKRTSEQSVTVPIAVTPSDATIRVNEAFFTERTLRLPIGQKSNVTVSRIGYKSLVRNGLVAEATGWKFILEPEPAHIQVLTSERSGKVYLDGHEIWNLEQGDLLDYQVSADSAQHALAARNTTGDLFRVEFQTAPGQAARVTPPQVRELLVSSVLGNEAKVFGGGQGNWSVGLPGKDPVELKREGTSLDLTGADPDQTVLTVSDAKRHQNLLLARSNAPTLTVWLNANPNLGTATISTAVQNARLIFDGRERKTRKPGTWRVSGIAGPHQFQLIADGYSDAIETIQIEKGRDTAQAFEMKPASSSLELEGGTAGAEVLIDDAVAGTLDGAGTLRASVAPGQHKVELRKAGYEGVTLRKTFAAGQALSLGGKDIAMRAFGTLTLAITPMNAAVQYRRVGEEDWNVAQGMGSLSLRSGKYEVAASASGFDSAKQEFMLAPGETYTAGLVLRPTQVAQPKKERQTRDYFVHSDQIQNPTPDWSTGSTSKFLELLPRIKFEFTFLAPELMNAKHRPKRFEWHLNVSPEMEISYELDGQQLTRKVKADGKVAKTTTPAATASGKSAYSVRVILEAHGIRVTKLDGTLLDEFTDTRYDWMKAGVLMKGDSYFVVRP